MPSHPGSEDAKEAANRARIETLSGGARKTAEAVDKRKEQNRRALDAASAALGIRRDRQTTDSNN